MEVGEAVSLFFPVWGNVRKKKKKKRFVIEKESSK